MGCLPGVEGREKCSRLAAVAWKLPLASAGMGWSANHAVVNPHGMSGMERFQLSSIPLTAAASARWPVEIHRPNEPPQA